MASLFTATDPRGRTVICSDEIWYHKILVKHPIMKGLEDEVILTIAKPDYGFIYADADRQDRNIYYRLLRKRNLYIKVAVEYSQVQQGRVITAFLTDSPKTGEKLIWPESNA